jgi:hypothetical protein
MSLPSTALPACPPVGLLAVCICLHTRVIQVSYRPIINTAICPCLSRPTVSVVCQVVNSVAQQSSLRTIPSSMLSTTPLRVLRVGTSQQVATRRFASHGAPHYNEPTGYIFGEKVRDPLQSSFASIDSGFQPPAPGQKRVKEDWENIWYFGMFGSIGLATVLLYYKPDTRCVPFRSLMQSA